MDNVNITIISATNRAGSNTLRVARQIEGMLLERGVRAGLLTLEGLDLNGRTETLYRIERELLFPARKFIFVAPEYNGSYPGSLKTMIDLTDIKQAWWGKKAMLTGVSTGRAGNLRGLEHLTGTLNYLKVTVLPNRLPISVVDKLMDADGVIRDESTLAAMSAQIDEFLAC
ncbi:MAG: NADPH-dependent FMN reductase [bacterium]|jgi:chromate reductase|nr:NAD(P)H-dependent oxidoreductase [Chitinophagaceae bacterium]